IWTNVHITLLDYADILPNPFTLTDHSIISLELTLDLPKINTQYHPTRTIYQWKLIQKEQIENYQNHTEQNLKQLLTSINNITHSSELNNIWNQINKALTKAAQKHIPFKRIKLNPYYNEQQQPNLSPLYIQFKQAVLLKTSLNKPNFIQNYNSYITKYLQNTLLPLLHLTPTNNNFDSTTSLTLFTNEIKTLKTKIHKEKQEITLKEIQNKLEERNNNFYQNPKIFFQNV